MTDHPYLFPFRPGDWVTDDGCNSIAKVKSVDLTGDGEVLFDLWMYSRQGDRLGRISPVMGGPRTFEPCCSTEGWIRIPEPRFPITIKWLPSGDGDKLIAKHWAGDPLPPANWKKPKRRAPAIALSDDTLRRALEKIAAGHNDAIQLAREVLRLT